MKLATFLHAGVESIGLLDADGLLNLRSAWPDAPADMVALLQAGPAALKKVAQLAREDRRRIPLDQAQLLAPLRPGKVLGLAVNYAEHHKESSAHPLPSDPRRNTTPRPFLMPGTTLRGPGETIPWPDYSTQIDHEVELAVVLGAVASRVSPQQARDCIAGYTIANDVSARSVTHAQGRAVRDKDAFFDWLHGKWADGFCPIGPTLTTADEIGDPQDLDLELAVNGEIRQKANTSQMIFDVFQVVSFVSHLMTLLPGDLIATGTPSGVAMATGKWLRGGDVITCRIAKIGELTNTLAQPPKEFYTPCLG
jgi:2-keto-4-pentenoate hydratase/2-oxohepta-3-ene-1,7-dioic acid hydratase in catechol pathway